ncbi:uncharacterized protein ARMOST_12232 [Armillaria ostoyae]|uniref:Uncharacterized protein n=1 Tax=Armillaria ostoyae TaxID=47428 RepID=A0A284RJB4_ARMOS|nr:uncharacterized protein ARMOST_12232 [Armillaria ostoyae]
MGELPELGANGDEYDSFMSGLKMPAGLYLPYFDHQEAVFHEILPASYVEQHVETMQDQGRTPRVIQFVRPPPFLCPESSSRPTYVFSFYLPPPLSLGPSVRYTFEACVSYYPIPTLSNGSTLSPSELVQEGYTLNDGGWDARWFSSSLFDDLDVSMDWQNSLIPEMYTGPTNCAGDLDFRTDTTLGDENPDVYPAVPGGDPHRDYVCAIATGVLPPWYSPPVSGTTNAVDVTGGPSIIPWQVSLSESIEFLLTLLSVLRDIGKFETALLESGGKYWSSAMIFSSTTAETRPTLSTDVLSTHAQTHSQQMESRAISKKNIVRSLHSQM